MKRTKVLFTLLFAVFFMLALALSLSFTAAMAEHDCCGEVCQICAELQVADAVCGGGGTEVLQTQTTVRFAPVNTLDDCAKDVSCAADSPVSRCDILTI